MQGVRTRVKHPHSPKCGGHHWAPYSRLWANPDSSKWYKNGVRRITTSKRRETKIKKASGKVWTLADHNYYRQGPCQWVISHLLKGKWRRVGHVAPFLLVNCSHYDILRPLLLNGNTRGSPFFPTLRTGPPDLLYILIRGTHNKSHYRKVGSTNFGA